MEYVCVGGAFDGSRVQYSNPPHTIYFSTYKLKQFYDSDPSAVPVTIPHTVETYKLEILCTSLIEVFFYRSNTLTLEEAMLLLVSNYAIGDPTKTKY